MLGRVSEASSGERRRYYLTDRLGSVRTVVEEGGTLGGARDYYPFGLRLPGRVATSGGEVEEDYTGHPRDESTQLHYAGARYYMSALGRWTTTDPLGDSYPSHSPYNYVMNNPTNLTDPTGACPEDGSAGDAGDGDGYCLEEVVVTAERPEGAGAFVSGNTFFFNSSTRGGRSGLYDFMRSNPGATRQMIGNNSYSMRAQQVAFNANIHNSQALFLRRSLEMGAQGASAVALLSGVGTVGGAVAQLALRRSAIQLTNYAATASLYAAGTEVGLRTAAIPVGGNPDAAVNAALGFATGAVVGAGATRLAGVGATGLRGPAFRATRNLGKYQPGQFVSNKVGLVRNGAAMGGVGVAGISSPLVVPYLFNGE